MLEEGLLSAAGEPPIATYSMHVSPGQHGVIVTRRFDAFDPVVLSVTRLSTGDGAINVIPESVELAATICTMSHESLTVLEEVLPRVINGVAAAHELTAEVSFEKEYPVTVNDPSETEATLETLRSIYGEQRAALLPSPMMGSEDFAFVLDEVPGTFVGLFTSPPEMKAEEIEWNHSPRVVFDDAVLADQAAALAVIAFKRIPR